MTHPATDAPPERLYFLDWLRAAAFGLLILYHVGMYYVSWDWHIKSPFAEDVADTIEPLMLLSSPWRLALLFLVSGAATAMMLRPRPGQAPRPFVRERSRRLLLPLLLGMFVIVPPQAYLEVVSAVAYPGSYLDFMRLYLQGYDGFCDGDGCLELPTWNHLWFVAYLWVYSLLLWALLKAWPQMLDTLAALAERRLDGWALWLVPAAVLGAWRMGLVGLFPSTHALVDDFYNHAVYLSVFLAGAVLARWGGGWVRFSRWRWGALALALGLWALLIAYFTHYGDGRVPPEWLRMSQRMGYGLLQWSAIIAALGFAHRHWNRDHRWRQLVVDIVFPVYLLHQTLIILIAWGMRGWGLAPAVEAPLLIGATAVSCVAGALLAARLGPLRVWFGWPPRAAKAVAVGVPAAA
ncbi:MAG: acyltransferase family protein [Pseudomonadota bacterium]